MVDNRKLQHAFLFTCVLNSYGFVAVMLNFVGLIYRRLWYTGMTLSAEWRWDLVNKLHAYRILEWSRVPPLHIGLWVVMENG